MVHSGRTLTILSLRSTDNGFQTMKETPEALDAIADVVLAYRAKPKSKPAKKRKRRAAKIVKEKTNG